MDTKSKSEQAVLKVLLRATELGVLVSRPFVDTERYDLILDEKGKLSRAQVKYADGHSKSKNSVLLTLRRRGKDYAKEDVDILLVYVPKVDKVLRFKASDFCGKSAIMIRLAPTLNGQNKKTIRFENFIWV